MWLLVAKNIYRKSKSSLVMRRTERLISDAVNRIVNRIRI